LQSDIFQQLTKFGNEEKNGCGTAGGGNTILATDPLSGRTISDRGKGMEPATGWCKPAPTGNG